MRNNSTQSKYKNIKDKDNSPQFSDEKLQNNAKQNNLFLFSIDTQQNITDVQTSQDMILQEKEQKYQKYYNKNQYNNNNTRDNHNYIRKQKLNTKNQRYIQNVNNKQANNINNYRQFDEYKDRNKKINKQSNKSNSFHISNNPININNNNRYNNSNRQNQQQKKGSYPFLDQSRESTRFQKPQNQRSYSKNYNNTKKNYQYQRDLLMDKKNYHNEDIHNKTNHNNNHNNHNNFIQNNHNNFTHNNRNIFTHNNYEPESINKSPNSANNITSAQLQKKQKFLNILQAIQLINYKQQNKNKQSLRKQFIAIVNQHIEFQDKYYPIALTEIGTMLIKNGIFHEMWSKVIFKCIQLSRKQLLCASYYQKYLNQIQKGLTGFQKSFNPTPPSSDQDCLQYAEQAYRNYIQMRNNNNGTKQNCLLLYQSIRKQLLNQRQNDKIYEGFKNDIKVKVDNYKIRTAEEELIIKANIIDRIDNINNHINIDDKTSDNIDNSEKNISANNIESFVVLNNKQAISLYNQKITYKKSTCSLEILFQVCISNEKRFMCQMACRFLNITRVYKLSQMEIIDIKQTYFNERQQISILKAYTAQFCPLECMMKIQPRLKTLISVYKFAGLIQLVRLQKIYGKFDGIVLYSDYLNMEKFLLSMKQNNMILQSGGNDMLEQKYKIKHNQQ